MTATDRRAREQAQTREKILSAARDLFVRHGYEAVSMRKIADAIEYTPPVIYSHFRDKADLMLELCRRDCGTLVEKTGKLRRVEDPVQRLLKMGMAYIRFALEHPNHYRLMFMTPHPEDVEPSPEDLAAIGDPERDSFAIVVEAAALAIERGRFRKEYRDPHLVAQVLWSGVHGVASLQITHKDDPWISWRSVERRSRGLCEALLRGMLSEPSELNGRGGAA
jgi:AcrR family transcriptional regulator